jgi:hypothetical protein
MLKRIALFVSATAAFALAVYASGDKPAEEPKQPPIPEMKFNDVKEIAPGVFFRYSSISATDKTVPFGGSNETWIVFKDFVVVVDASGLQPTSGSARQATIKPEAHILEIIEKRMAHTFAE